MQARKSSANTTWLCGTVLPPYVFEWQHGIMFFCVSCDQLHTSKSAWFWLTAFGSLLRAQSCLAVLKVSLRDVEGTDFKDHVYYQDKNFLYEVQSHETCCLVWAGRQKMQKAWSEAKGLKRQTWHPSFLQGRSYTLHQSGMKCNDVWYKMFLNQFLTADQKVGLHSCDKGAHYTQEGTCSFTTGACSGSSAEALW